MSKKQHNRLMPYIEPRIQEGIVFLLLAIALCLYALINHYSTKGLEWKLSPYLFPALISIFLGVLASVLLFEGLRDHKEHSNACTGNQESTEEATLQNETPNLSNTSNASNTAAVQNGSIRQPLRNRLRQFGATENRFSEGHRSFAILILSIAYFFGMQLITFIPSTALFLIAAFLVLGERRLWIILTLSGCTTVVTYVLFDVILHVQLP